MTDEQLLVERAFTVDLPAARAWQALADLEAWPAWAPHIRSVTLTPAGTLGPRSRGRLNFRPIGSAEFAMRTWQPPREWTWTGRALGLPIRYVHAFEAVDQGRTRLRWRVELDGSRPGVRARVFAWVYARLLDRAWPRFRDRAAAQGSR